MLCLLDHDPCQRTQSLGPIFTSHGLSKKNKTCHVKEIEILCSKTFWGKLLERMNAKQ